MSEIIERAIVEPGKICAAGQSLAAWYRTECYRLQAERRLFNEKLQKTSDLAARAEIVAAFAENEVEERDLQAGWKGSTLRARLTPAENTENGPDRSVETRLLLSPGTERPQLQQKAPQIGVNTQLKLSGLAAVYGKRSANLGDFFEIIQDGAFDAVLAGKPDVRCLFNHSADHLLSRTSAGTLRLSSISAVGLNFWCDLIPEDSLSTAIAERISRRDLSGCSFSFRVARDKWVLQPGQTDLRVIQRISHLYDVGPVTFPAYPDTTVAVVDLRNQKEPTADDEPDIDDDKFEDEEFNDFLRERKEIDRNYRKAGRIISRCRQHL
jgi:hypothetical protein